MAKAHITIDVQLVGWWLIEAVIAEAKLYALISDRTSQAREETTRAFALARARLLGEPNG